MKRNLVLQGFSKLTEDLCDEHVVPGHLSADVERAAGVDEPDWVGAWGIDDARIAEVWRLMGLRGEPDTTKLDWFLATYA